MKAGIRKEHIFNSGLSRFKLMAVPLLIRVKAEERKAQKKNIPSHLKLFNKLNVIKSN